MSGARSEATRRVSQEKRAIHAARFAPALTFTLFNLGWVTASLNAFALLSKNAMRSVKLPFPLTSSASSSSPCSPSMLITSLLTAVGEKWMPSVERGPRIGGRRVRRSEDFRLEENPIERCRRVFLGLALA